MDQSDDPLTLDYLLNLLQGSLTPDGTIFIATTNNYDDLDEALVRIGRFDVTIKMRLCDRFQIATIYKKFIDRDLPKNILNRIEEDKFTPADIIFHVKKYLLCKNNYSDEEIMQKYL